jgi:hypothetical protein
VHRLQKRLVQQLHSARRLLSARRPSAKAVHATRQHVKRGRAVLRLLRSTIDDADYRRVNFELRDINRALRGARDTPVMFEALASIGRRAPELKRAVAVIQQRWKQQRKDRQTPSLGSKLALSSQAIGHWKIGKYDVSSARSALRAAYRKARRAYRLAVRQGSDSNWHECRKQTKYLYYQLQFAKVLGFRPPGATARARALGALLGREQDLALLRAALRRGGGNRNATNRALLKYIDLRCARLCSKASAAGSRLYRRSARAFAESLRATAGRRR